MFGVEHAFFLFVFIKSIGVGFLIGALYSFFMLLRACGLNGKLAVFFQDLFFCISAAVLSFLALFDIIAGKPRFFFLLGEAVGFLAFYLLPGKACVFMLKNAFIKCKRARKTKNTKKE